MRNVRVKALLLLGAAAVFIAGVVVVFRQSSTAISSHQYARPGSCQACHAAIAASYRESGMARSFYKPTPENFPIKQPAKFYHAASNRHYAMFWRDGKLIQRRWREDNVFELEVHSVIGSGNHARTFLHRNPNGEITELPLTWYAHDNNWGMSPGFDRPKHPDFTRQIDHGCMFCHNSYPDMQGGDDRFGRIAVFPAELPQGIDCQRCHGPGAEHVARASRETIVNPARLSPALQMDICLQCHLETTSAQLPASTRRFRRSVYSYRPGEPLTDYMVHFDHAPRTGHDGKFEIVGAAYRLKKSACYLKSEGRLTCTTCHNPHQVVRGDAAKEHYRKQCRQCHTQLTSHADPMKSDCAGCHMPKRRTEDAVHVVMTDHLIQRRKPAADLLAPIKEKSDAYRGGIVAYYPDKLPETEQDAYLGIALAAHAADRPRGIALLERAIQSSKSVEPKIWTSLGDARMAEGEFTEAAKAYAAALQLDTGLEKARYNYAHALERLGDSSGAQRQYEQLISARSGFAEAHTRLGDLLAKGGETERAAAEYQTAIQSRATDPEPHSKLATLMAGKGDLAGALNAARKAARLDPDNAEVSLNVGRLLYMQGDHRAAIEEFERLVKAHPQFAEAHLSLGIAYGETGRLKAAVAEFREVLRIQPNHPEARKNLDLASQMLSVR